ncbi:hypothetical protein LIA77_06436 [Sarocladium implicatum]|nr:hypothetical protein LIA77_06436 [Sarocladium implicatum]
MCANVTMLAKPVTYPHGKVERKERPVLDSFVFRAVEQTKPDFKDPPLQEDPQLRISHTLMGKEAEVTAHVCLVGFDGI